ncbi:MAG TPA: ABC transporter substrate-binding protein [Burkholderiales bacterium]|nr:ABC transporter substrate-binding protein [Burkholderiales bacterium]
MIVRLRILAMAMITLAGAVSAYAQETGAVPVIGVLRTSSAMQYDPSMEAIRTELRAMGYTEGQNIRIEQRFANRRVEQLPKLANELVRMKVKLIVAVNEASLRAAKQATSTVPIIVVAYDHDPVASGLIDSMTRPGGNVTGIFSRQVELGGKRLELLKEMVPGLTRVAVVHDPARRAIDKLEAAAKPLGLQLRLVELKNPKGFEESMKRAAKTAQAAMLLYSPMIYEYRIRLITLATEARLPTMTQSREFVMAGALMSYAPDRTEVAGRVAYFIDRLLRGATPSELPVEEAATFKLTVNLKTAKALGIAIPQSILLRADEVIR